MSFKLVFLPPHDEVIHNWASRLAAMITEAQVVVPRSVEQAMAEIVDADAAFGTLPLAMLERAMQLRWLQAPAAAPPAGYYYPELVQHPVVVTNFRGIFNDHVANHAMAFVLAFARGLQHYLPQQFRGEWNPAPPSNGVVHLAESTALIIGVGGIGSEIARLCTAFGIRVIGVDARETTSAGDWELHPPDALDTLLGEADWVIMTVPHTPHTAHMMHADRFRLMKRAAVLINVGRGMTVKLDDLNVALRQCEIGGAGLDVFEIEPLPADHPLWTAPNVLLTPHIAAYGPYLDERRFEIIVDNARRFAQGLPLHNVVDKEVWF